MSKQEAIAKQYEQYLISNYRRFPVTLVKGEGSWIWDIDGKKYLDLFPGWGVAGIGHCHPKVAEAVTKQVTKLIHCANNYYGEEQAEFAEILSTRAGRRRVFFANSGAEANEGAIKLTRLAQQPKFRIITMKESFHGRTFAAITATGQPEYQAGFAPLVPGFSYATFNDLASVEALVNDETAGIMVEPVQGESGVHPATLEFLKGLRSLCDKKGILLIFDEVQTSPARLGTWFGYQYFGVEPDIITTAKAIAGGLPMGVILANPAIAPALKPGTHASTFGGNALGCAAGIAAFHAIESENMMDNIKRQGAWIDERLKVMQKKTGNAIKAVRRCGFMIGIELSLDGNPLVATCRDKGLLVNCTHNTVLRMLPAFNITTEELAVGMDILEDCLKAS